MTSQLRPDDPTPRGARIHSAGFAGLSGGLLLGAVECVWLGITASDTFSGFAEWLGFSLAACACLAACGATLGALIGLLLEASPRPTSLRIPRLSWSLTLAALGFGLELANLNLYVRLYPRWHAALSLACLLFFSLAAFTAGLAQRPNRRISAVLTISVLLALVLPGLSVDCRLRWRAFRRGAAIRAALDWLDPVARVGWAIPERRSQKGSAPPEPAVTAPVHPLPKADVLLVTIDTLRADRVNARTTPTLHGLLAEASYFSGARAPAPWTIPSVYALFTGRYPSQVRWAPHPSLGSRYNLPIEDESPTLAALLDQQGYRTVGVHTHSFLQPELGLPRGFRELRVPTAMGFSDSRLTADEVLAEALPILAYREDPRPLFLWVHLFDPHFVVQDHPALGRNGPGPLARYEAAVQYTDAAFARLLEAANQRRRSRPQILVVAGDHGEEFGEHGGSGRDHGTSVYEEEIAVPLIIRATVDGSAGRVIPSPSSLVDVLPTLMGLLGLPTPTGVAGRSLLGDGAPGQGQRARFSELRRAPEHQVAVVQGSLKLIADLSRGYVELYDLQRDPGELHEVSRSHPGQVQALLAAVDAYTQGRP